MYPPPFSINPMRSELASYFTPCSKSARGWICSMTIKGLEGSMDALVEKGTQF